MRSFKRISLTRDESVEGEQSHKGDYIFTDSLYFI